MSGTHNDRGPTRVAWRWRAAWKRHTRREAGTISVILITLLLLTMGLPSFRSGVSLPGGGLGAPALRTTPESAEPTSHPSLTPVSKASISDAATLASAQFAWSSAQPPPVGNLTGAGFASDPLREESILFGGASATTLLNRTWTYWESNNSWSTVPTPAGLTPRSDFGFAADSLSQVGVLFGGLANATSDQVVSDTWTFNFTNGTWTNVTQGVAPAARQDPAFAVAPTLGKALLFGGWNRNLSGTGALLYSDTWILNLTTYVWSHVSTSGANQPPPLEGAGLSWDPVLGQFELFGGCFPCSSDVWRFTPATGLWSEVTVGGTIPPPRSSPAWAYDPAQGQDVLFGGIGNGGPLNDTYVWNPATGNWTAQTFGSHPTARSAAAATWMDVPDNETLLLTEGAAHTATADLWRLAPMANLSIRVYNLTSHLPVVSASVTLDGTDAALTNALGYRNISQVTPVEHVVGAIAPGYAPSSFPLWVDPGLLSHVAVNLTPIPPADLTVLVTSDTGNPISGAQVAVRIQGVLVQSPPLITNSSGYVSYTGIPTYTVEVTASAVYFHNNSTVVNLVSGQDTLVKIQLIPYPVAWVHVLGYLPPLGFSQPLYRAYVSVDESSEGYTDLSGEAFVQLDVDGVITVSVSAPGFSPNQMTEDAPFTGLFSVNITLTSLPFGAVHVLVLEAGTHFPIAEAGVNFTTVPGSPLNALLLTGETGANGYSNNSYPPTNYSITVQHPGFLENSSITDLHVSPSSVQRITVNLTPLPATGTPGGNGTFYLIPPGQPVAWVFLIVPLLLLLAGGTYLGLTRGEPTRSRTFRPTPRLRKPPPSPSPRRPPMPPPSE